MIVLLTTSQIMFMQLQAFHNHRPQAIAGTGFPCCHMPCREVNFELCNATSAGVRDEGQGLCQATNVWTPGRAVESMHCRKLVIGKKTKTHVPKYYRNVTHSLYSSHSSNTGPSSLTTLCFLEESLSGIQGTRFQTFLFFKGNGLGPILGRVGDQFRTGEGSALVWFETDLGLSEASEECRV